MKEMQRPKALGNKMQQILLNLPIKTLTVPQS